MAAPSICCGSPGTQAFAAQPKAPPTPAIQSKYVGVRNAVKNQLEKTLLGPGDLTGSVLVYSILLFLCLYNFSSGLLVAF